MVQTSPSSLDVPIEFPYNLSNATCTVYAEVKGQRVPLNITVIWVYREVSQDDSVSFSNISSTYFTTTGSPKDGYLSTLHTVKIKSERDKIRCRANLVVDSSIRSISDIGMLLMNKPGLKNIS